MKTLLFLALACIGLFSSCKDRDADPNTLPEATQSGKNTFGVKINGKAYTPKSSKNDLSNIGYPTYNGVWDDFSYDENKTFSPLVSLDNVNLTRIILRINDPKGITSKEYMLNGQDQNNPQGRITIGYLIYETTTLKKQYNAIPNSGSIIITKNDNNVISGVFSGKLQNVSDANDKLEITEGRFDFNKNTINDYKFP
ncbi:hypothetical protein QGN23_10200 [Chryseobacterium gotjawalense]|uniref:DUF4840 domain-containing protein n=1 Tax=Chryseobacterium gotjawalense TaxID=3042315 RepID=A0ABY8RC44_9FLAO|nr:hypothetical protein [Chryseobacterium sp. wdc7]WHF50802.1 hypothetical protein QGN23_10200 [Chryseobacterium sp. wdc7]